MTAIELKESRNAGILEKSGHFQVALSVTYLRQKCRLDFHLLTARLLVSLDRCWFQELCLSLW